jgi:hypothetical protein
MTPHLGFACALCVVLTLAGCAKAQPRQRPLNTTPIASGAGTMEVERKKLQGRWMLVSLTVVSENGRKAAVDATGVLTFDGFGNLQIEYRMSESGRQTLESLGIKVPNPVLSTAGNVAIDPAGKQITYVGSENQKKALGFDPDLAARRANPFTLERVRYYRFEDDNALTLMTRHDDGSEGATAVWKRSS